MMRIFKIFILVLLCAGYSFADDVDKQDRELIALEDEAGRMKSQIIKLQNEISILEKNIKEIEENISRTQSELYDILNVLNFISIEKKINNSLFKDIEMKNVRYGEYISRLISKYNENLLVLNNLREDYSKRREELNNRLLEVQSIENGLLARIDKIYSMMSEKKREYEAMNIKARKKVVMEKEESVKKLGGILRDIGTESGKEEKKEEGELFRISWPVREGDIIREYGTYYDDTMNLEKFSRGILIKSRFLSEVFCVADGKVVFSGWLKGFGNTVIVKHNNGFISVYSHLARIEVKKGDEIKGMDILGFVGDTGSSEGVVLYFELRKDGKAVDPASYLK